jgi:hypothetical protein
MNALKMQEYNRNLESQNALRASPAPEGVNAAHWQIDPTKALALAKAVAETKNLASTGQHLAAQTKDLTVKALGLTFDNFTKLNPPTAAANSADGVRAYITNLYADPLLGAVAAKQMPLEQAIKINTEGWATDPKQWAAAHMGLTGDTLFKTLQGTRQNTNLGGTNKGETIDAFGRVVPGLTTSTPRTMTPYEEKHLPILQQTANAAASNARTAADRLKQEGLGVTYQTDAQGNIIALPSRLASNIKPVARPVIGEGGAAVKGKPSAFAEKTAIQQKQLGVDIGRTIGELENAAKPGGLIEQSTGSGIGRAIDASAAFVGRAMPGAIAIGKLAPIADMVLKMVPRFEGPQSDKDTTSYKQAAGQLADASLPVAIRQAAATEIVRLMKARKEQFSSTDIEAGGGSPPPAAGTPKVVEFGSLK